MFNIAIYSKTMKGRMEIAERRHGLSLRLRQALILVDGHTPYGMLRVMLQHLGEPEELIGRKTFDIIHPDDIDRCASALKRDPVETSLRH